MKTKIFAFAALATMLASCTVEVTEQSLTGKPITVTADVDKLMTRAGYEGTSVLPETFYLSLDQSNDKYDYTDMLMTKSADGNVYTPASQLLWAGSADATVTAATFSLSGKQELSVATDQSTSAALQSSDHLFMAGRSVTPSSEGIAVEFGHLMSKVFITITLGDEFEEEENPITAIAVKGTVPTRSYTAGSGWGSLSATAADIIPLENVYTAPTSSQPRATAEYEVILVPQEVAARGFVVSFSIGARKFKWTAPAGITLESGCQYTLDISAGKSKVTMGATSVRDWNCIAIEGGDAEEVEEGDDDENENLPSTAPAGVEAVDLGLSVKWASCNVGAESPEEYGGYYAWGETTTKSDYNSSTSITYGLSTWELESLGIIDADGNLTSAYDAATANWGGSWRMPTKDEQDELRTKCDWAWTTMNGVNGYQVTGPNGNSLFLPAAGYRLGTSLSNAGSDGYYWSATPAGNSYSAYFLYFDSDYYDWYYGFNRGYGFTVLPVSEQ